MVTAQRHSMALPAGDAGDGLIHVSRRSLVLLKQDAARLSLRAVQVRSADSGGHLSRFKGRGMEFDEARLYQPGDDVRTIDWRVTARRGKPHTKLFREERDRAVFCWVDFRAPMYFATRGAFKSVLAAKLAAALGWSARAHGDRLGGLAFSESGHKELRPGTGDHSVMKLIGMLADLSAQPPEETTPELRRNAIRNALARLRRVARPGSLIFLVSDFRGLDGQCEHHFQSLAPHNDLVLIHLHDRLEAELPKHGRYRLRGNQRTLLLDADDPRRRLAHHEKFQRHHDSLEDMCRRYRMHLLSCDTREDPLEVLQRGLGRKPR